MLLIRDVMNCKPGKVRPMVEMFRQLASLSGKHGLGKIRVLTDVSGERFWTAVIEVESPDLETFLALDNSAAMKELAPVMKGYHDCVDRGRREIFKIEA